MLRFIVNESLLGRNLKNYVPAMTPSYILPSWEDPAVNGWNRIFAGETSVD